MKIEGSTRIDQAGPEQFAVILENASESTLSGAVRVDGIDGWSVDPAGQQPVLGGRERLNAPDAG